MPANPAKSLILVAKLVLLTIVLMIISGVGAQFLPTASMGGEQPVGASLGTILAIMLCQVVALAIPILRSHWFGWRLTAVIFVVYFGTVTFMSQVESLVYLGGQMPEGLVSGLFVMGLFTAAIFSPIAVFTLGKWRSPSWSGAPRASRLNLGAWGWRVAVSGMVYLALYYLFGYYVAWQDPELRAYYGGTDPGSFLAQMQNVAQGTPWMLPFQYVRGLLWVGLGLLIIRSMEGAWWQAGLAAALLFSVPSLYLLFPNPVMPDFPRMTHLVETLPYQFMFGWFLAWFLRRRVSGDPLS